MKARQWSDEKLAEAIRERVMLHPSEKSESYGRQVLDEAARRIISDDQAPDEDEPKQPELCTCDPDGPVMMHEPECPYGFGEGTARGREALREANRWYYETRSSLEGLSGVLQSDDTDIPLAQEYMSDVWEQLTTLRDCLSALLESTYGPNDPDARESCKRCGSMDPITVDSDNYRDYKKCRDCHFRWSSPAETPPETYEDPTPQDTSDKPSNESTQEG